MFGLDQEIASLASGAPLVALAFLSLVAGYVSWPKVLGGSEQFDHYLEPVFGQSEAVLRSATARSNEGLGTRALMTFSLTAAALGILLAAWFYLKATELPKRLAVRFGGLYRLLVNKYYIDEFYNWLVVQPIRQGSEKVLWRAVDEGAIDDIMVNGAAGATAGVGGVLRRVQSGNLRSYATWVLLGAVLWLGYVLLR